MSNRYINNCSLISSPAKVMGYIQWTRVHICVDKEAGSPAKVMGVLRTRSWKDPNTLSHSSFNPTTPGDGAMMA